MSLDSAVVPLELPADVLRNRFSACLEMSPASHCLRPPLNGSLGRPPKPSLVFPAALLFC